MTRSLRRCTYVNRIRARPLQSVLVYLQAPDEDVPMAVDPVEHSTDDHGTQCKPQGLGPHGQWSGQLLAGCSFCLPLPSQGLPFLLAPVRALPTLIESLQDDTETTVWRSLYRSEYSPLTLTQGCGMHMCAQAVDGSLNPMTQSLETSRMQAELRGLTARIAELHRSHVNTMAQVEANRLKIDRITHMTAALRAQMLTRQNRHRSVLVAHGVHDVGVFVAHTHAYTASNASAAPAIAEPTTIREGASAMDVLAALAPEMMKASA
jgi:hypothetical protein